MKLKDVRAALSTTTDAVIFVNADIVGDDNDKPFVYFEGQTYIAVKHDHFYPNGIDFKPEFDELEVEILSNDIYEKYGDSVGVAEIFVG